jgi:hypothetical protein
LPIGDPVRTLKISILLLTALMVGTLFASDCKNLWLSVVFIAVISLVIPSIMLAMGKLKMPLIHGVSLYAFIGFSLFGSIAMLFGLFGLFSEEGFLTTACTGTDLSTRFAIKTLGFLAKGL